MSTSISAIVLHPRLAADTLPLAESAHSLLRLMNNALVPWFILVPKTDCRELHHLDPRRRRQVQEEVDAIADLLEREFRPDKLNIASIGNLVPQLHIHVIARCVTDVYWPFPVWGRPERRAYEDAEVERLRALVLERLGASGFQ